MFGGFDFLFLAELLLGKLCNLKISRIRYSSLERSKNLKTYVSFIYIKVERLFRVIMQFLQPTKQTNSPENAQPPVQADPQQLFSFFSQKFSCPP